MGRPDLTEFEYARLRLKQALQALAVPAEVQRSLFPDFVCKADELALDFDDTYQLLRGAAGMSDAQMQALEAIDARLQRMSRLGPEYEAGLWRDEALHLHPHWDEVRRLAADALGRFGWPVEPPPREPGDRGYTFVR